MTAMTALQWPEVRAIYRAGIDTGHATFGPTPPASWAPWQVGSRIRSTKMFRSLETLHA